MFWRWGFNMRNSLITDACWRASSRSERCTIGASNCRLCHTAQYTDQCDFKVFTGLNTRWKVTVESLVRTVRSCGRSLHHNTVTEGDKIGTGGLLRISSQVALQSSMIMKAAACVGCCCTCKSVSQSGLFIRRNKITGKLSIPQNTQAHKKELMKSWRIMPVSRWNQEAMTAYTC